MRKIKIKNLFASKRKPKRLISTKLIGKKVILRKLKVTDAVYLYDTYEDLRNEIYTPYNKLNNVDDVTVYLMDYTSKYETGKSIGWAITSSKTNEFVGVIHVLKFKEVEKQCTISFYTVKGLKDPYIIESIKMVVEYLFSTGLVRRIEADIDSDDSFSEIALIKCGFTLEGTKRKYAYYGEQYHDVKLYSILDEEVILVKEK